MTRNAISFVQICGVLFGYGWGYTVSVFYSSGRSRQFNFGGGLPVSAMVSVLPKSVHLFIASHNLAYSVFTTDFDNDHVTAYWFYR